MLANVNAFGAPVATARYMGGREYEAIAQSGDEPTVDAVIEVLSQGAIALPSFASAGPYSGQAGRLEGVESLHGTAARRARHALLGAHDRGAHRISGHRGRNLRRWSAGA